MTEFRVAFKHPTENNAVKVSFPRTQDNDERKR